MVIQEHLLTFYAVVERQSGEGYQKRYPYTVLLSRVFKEDLGACEKCGGKMRFVACIDDRKVIHRILSHLDLPTEMPPKAPARAPPQMDFGDWDLAPDDDAAGSWVN